MQNLSSDHQSRLCSFHNARKVVTRTTAVVPALQELGINICAEGVRTERSMFAAEPWRYQPATLCLQNFAMILTCTLRAQV